MLQLQITRSSRLLRWVVITNHCDDIWVKLSCRFDVCNTRVSVCFLKQYKNENMLYITNQAWKIKYTFWYFDVESSEIPAFVPAVSGTRPLFFFTILKIKSSWQAQPTNSENFIINQFTNILAPSIVGLAMNWSLYFPGMVDLSNKHWFK